MAQTSGAKTCDLSPDRFPAIRGLRLGLSSEQVLAVYPTDAVRAELETAREQSRAPGRYDYATTDLSGADLGNPAAAAGIVRIALGFYQDRLVHLYVEYASGGSGSAKWRNVEEFVDKIASVLQLPKSTEWEIGSNGDRVLKCEGFEVRASLTSTPTLSLFDGTFASEVERRRAADEEEKRQQFHP